MSIYNLIDGRSIPELIALANKLNFIVTGGDNEQDGIQLTPEFINMVANISGNGDGVKSVVAKYYLSTSREALIGGNWITTLPSIEEQKNKFLWYKIVTTYINETKAPTETEPICISANSGHDGQDGQDGTDGYTTILSPETLIINCDSDGNPIL